MQTLKYVYWQENETWLGYLEEYPDYWTRGESLDELSGDTNSDPLRPVLIPTPVMLPCYRFLPPFSGPLSVFTSGSR